MWATELLRTVRQRAALLLSYQRPSGALKALVFAQQNPWEQALWMLVADFL
jgi:hypothetical protein